MDILVNKTMQHTKRIFNFCFVFLYTTNHFSELSLVRGIFLVYRRYRRGGIWYAEFCQNTCKHIVSGTFSE